MITSKDRSSDSEPPGRRRHRRPGPASLAPARSHRSSAVSTHAWSLTRPDKSIGSDSKQFRPGDRVDAQVSSSLGSGKNRPRPGPRRPGLSICHGLRRPGPGMPRPGPRKPRRMGRGSVEENRVRKDRLLRRLKDGEQTHAQDWDSST